MAKLKIQPTWSGILDKPKSELNPEFFKPSGKLQEDFRGFVLQKIQNAKEEYGLEVRAALFYGGSASYQWSKESDIDISLYVNWEGDLSEYEKLQDDFKSQEYQYKGYPLHLFLKPLDQKEPIEVSEAVYSIINDEWVVEPLRFPTDFDPYTLFAKELKDSEILLQNYQSILSHLENSINSYVERPDDTLKLEIIRLIHQVYTSFIRLRKDRDALHEDLRVKVLKGEALKPLDRFKPAELNWKYLDKHHVLGTMKEIFLLVKEHKIPEFLKHLQIPQS